MSRVPRNYRICDQCGGVIPDGADHVTGVGGQMVYQGQARDPFADLDFCSSEHLLGWLGGQPTIPTPDPPYPTAPPA